MANSPIFFIPGPVNLSHEVLNVLSNDPALHYGSSWAETYHETITLVNKCVGSKSPFSILLPGTGTLGLETVFHNTVTTGDRVLVLNNGFFGDRLELQAKHSGAQVDVFHWEWEQPIDPDKVKEMLSTNNYRLVALVHHETSSGILNPIKEVCGYAKEYNVLTLVDAISSAGGVPIECDDWGIDFLVSVSNKCFEGTQGVAPIVISLEGHKAMEQRPCSKLWYLDLNVWYEFHINFKTSFPHPSTMPTNAIIAINTSIKNIFGFGLSSHFERYVLAAASIRDTLNRIGCEFSVKAEYLGPLLTPVKVENANHALALIQFMESKGIIIANGLGKYAGKCVRIANMGLASHQSSVERICKHLSNFYQ